MNKYSNDEIKLKKLKSRKKIGSSREGTIILSNNDKYTIKIYRLHPTSMKSYISLINYITPLHI